MKRFIIGLLIVLSYTSLSFANMSIAYKFGDASGVKFGWNFGNFKAIAGMDYKGIDLSVTPVSRIATTGSLDVYMPSIGGEWYFPVSENLSLYLGSTYMFIIPKANGTISDDYQINKKFNSLNLRTMDFYLGSHYALSPNFGIDGTYGFVLMNANYSGTPETNIFLKSIHTQLALVYNF